MAGRLDGKIALVTGGGSGIGRETALLFAREGAKVAVADRSAEAGEQTAQMIRQAGGESTFIAADVSREADVQAMIAQTVATYGRLDCAFNNAGIEGKVSSTIDYDEADWERVIGVNLKGVWLCLKHEIPQMLAQGSGSIVNTSSIAGLVGSRRNNPAYMASKHGVVGLTKTAALEYAPQGIRVNAVCPGRIRTEMHRRLINDDMKVDAELSAAYPLGRLGMPLDVAEMVVWLSSDAASFITGQAFAIDGGWTAQ